MTGNITEKIADQPYVVICSENNIEKKISTYLKKHESDFSKMFLLITFLFDNS